MLDETLTHAHPQPFEKVGVLMGLGNHGGGPTRRHLSETFAWAQEHSEVEVRFSTLHGFFETLRGGIASMSAREVPSVHGEFGYCLRGCYSSVQKFKSIFRQAEANVSSAEITQAFIGLLQPSHSISLFDAWNALMFNSFHDILPGLSIERAMDEQSARIVAQFMKPIKRSLRRSTLWLAEWTRGYVVSNHLANSPETERMLSFDLFTAIRENATFINTEVRDAACRAEFSGDARDRLPGKTVGLHGRKPSFIRSDNGSEFVAQSVRQWLKKANIGPCYTDPGSPWQNGHVGSFHASFRAELLEWELFFSVHKANAMIENWRQHYNFERPHGSLHLLPPLVALQRELPLRVTPSAPVHAGISILSH